MPAVEVMVSTAFIRDCIVDKEKTYHDPRRDCVWAPRSTACRRSISRSSASTPQDLVSYEEALRWASNVDEFKLKVQGISTTADMSRDQMAQSVATGKTRNHALR